MKYKILHLPTGTCLYHILNEHDLVLFTEYEISKALNPLNNSVFFNSIEEAEEHLFYVLTNGIAFVFDSASSEQELMRCHCEIIEAVEE
jgi:hypothetical protein